MKSQHVVSLNGCEKPGKFPKSDCIISSHWVCQPDCVFRAERIQEFQKFFNLQTERHWIWNRSRSRYLYLVFWKFAELLFDTFHTHFSSKIHEQTLQKRKDKRKRHNPTFKNQILTSYTTSRLHRNHLSRSHLLPGDLAKLSKVRVLNDTMDCLTCVMLMCLSGKDFTRG